MWDDVAERMTELGFERGWGATAARIREQFRLLLDILQVIQGGKAGRHSGACAPGRWYRTAGCGTVLLTGTHMGVSAQSASCMLSLTALTRGFFLRYCLCILGSRQCCMQFSLSLCESSLYYDGRLFRELVLWWLTLTWRLLSITVAPFPVSQAPDAECLERFLGRLPLVMNVVIMSPHGYFGQSNVLGLPDTGGQVGGG